MSCWTIYPVSEFEGLHMAERFDLLFSFGSPSFEFEDEEFGRLFRAVYEGVEPEGAPIASVRIGGTLDYALFLNGTLLHAGLDRKAAVGAIDEIIETWMREPRNDGVCCVHSSSVVYEDRMIALVGTSGSGKTTLSLALSEADAEYVGDEYGSLDYHTGEFWQERYPVRLKRRGAYIPAGVFHSDKSLEALSACGVPQTVIPRRAIDRISSSFRWPLGAFVFPSYEGRSDACVIERVSLAVLPSMLLSSMEGRVSNMQVLAFLLPVISSLGILLLRVSYGDAEIAARDILAFVEENRSW